MSDFKDEKTVLELLSKLVKIDSVNPVFGGPGEANVAGFLREWFEARGIAYDCQAVLPGRQNVFARVGPVDAPALMLEAHMDTVGVEGWSRGSPFELKQVGSRFFARGACDTKASLATFLTVFERFARKPADLGFALVFAATVDEESEQKGASKLATMKKELGIAHAITGEPTCSDVITRHKGVGRYLITTSGKAAHASTPELGDNALYKASRICQRLERYAAELEGRSRSSEIERGTVNVGVMRGGIGFNVVPDACQLDIDRRLGTGEDAASARAELEVICQTEDGSRLDVFLERPPLRGENSGAFCEALIRSARRAGIGVSEREVPYMTNAVAYEAAGIPAVVFGPGDIAQAHKNDEFIEEGQMLRSLKILEQYLMKKEGFVAPGSLSG